MFYINYIKNILSISSVRYPSYAIVTKTQDKNGRVIQYDDVLIKENDWIIVHMKKIKKEFVPHRIDGPANEYKTQPQYNTWWYNGKRIECKSQNQFNKIIKLKAFW